ncbi:MAG TPA: DUF2844 domain-containing protein [Dissulfurispiraceae bacterium]|nr:DUF2844 domain-containing protein [Dissulfurispiraceae bacterium]
MKIRIYSLFLALGLSIVCFVIAKPVKATLGESADSIESDRQVLSALQGPESVLIGYTVQEMESYANRVREYISPGGMVFGIAWNGRVHPALSQLLGSYEAEYRAALSRVHRNKGNRRSLQVKTPDIVVEKWGHMRDLRGRAYVPSLIPSGVSVDEIK